MLSMSHALWFATAALTYLLFVRVRQFSPLSFILFHCLSGVSMPAPLINMTSKAKTTRMVEIFADVFGKTTRMLDEPVPFIFTTTAG